MEDENSRRFRLSIIIPALHEGAGIRPTLECLPRAAPGSEVVLVDAGPGGRTGREALRWANRLAGHRIELQTLGSEPCRAVQMNLGASRARGTVLLFLHADTLLPPSSAELIEHMLSDRSVVGGGFRHRFLESTLGLRLISAWSNLRSRSRGLFYGDQAIFVRRAVFENLGGFRRLPVFEDIELCARMRRAGRLVVAPAAIRTSGRRFLSGGVARTAWEMTRMKWKYRSGVDPERLVGDYWDDSRRGRLL